MDANKTWELTQAMMTGDFNPNHDPSDGRFTSGSGGSLTPRKYNKSFFSEKRANQHVEYLKSQGATEIQTSSRKDAFGQNEYIVGWNMEERKSASGGGKTYGVNNLSFEEAYKAANTGSGIDFGKGKRAQKAARAFAKEATEHNYNKAKRGAQFSIYGVYQRGNGVWGVGPYSGGRKGNREDTTYAEYASRSEFMTASERKALRAQNKSKKTHDSAWEITERMMVGDFNPYHDEDGRFTSGGGSDYDDDYDDDDEDEDGGDVSTLRSMTEGNFWGRRSDLEEELEDAGFGVEDSNGEYIVVSSPDQGTDAQYELRLGGTERTITVRSIEKL